MTPCSDPDDVEQPPSPWMAKLSPESQESVRRNVAEAPPLTTRQRERLRLLFRHDAQRGDA